MHKAKLWYKKWLQLKEKKMVVKQIEIITREIIINNIKK